MAVLMGLIEKEVAGDPVCVFRFGSIDAQLISHSEAVYVSTYFQYLSFRCI